MSFRGLYKEMPTNTQGQSDIVIHHTNILSKVDWVKWTFYYITILNDSSSNIVSDATNMASLIDDVRVVIDDRNMILRVQNTGQWWLYKFYNTGPKVKS
jgi:hypothetical protein